MLGISGGSKSLHNVSDCKTAAQLMLRMQALKTNKLSITIVIAIITEDVASSSGSQFNSDILFFGLLKCMCLYISSVALFIAILHACMHATHLMMCATYTEVCGC